MERNMSAYEVEEKSYFVIYFIFNFIILIFGNQKTLFMNVLLEVAIEEDAIDEVVIKKEAIEEAAIKKEAIEEVVIQKEAIEEVAIKTLAMNEAQ